MATINSGPNAQEINRRIGALDYRPEEVLAFPGESISSFIPRTGELTPQKFVVVTKTKHTVSGSFDIAVPNARRNITYPGALLLANQKLVEGIPDPLVVPMAPCRLTIDLPGLTTEDNSVIPESNDFAGVSGGINKLIDHWLTAKSPRYTIAANTEFKKNILYSESEMALHFGVDVAYLKGKLGINFDAIMKQETSAYLVMFRQIFYTVSAELPQHPADIFAESVSWKDLSGKISAKTPPVYVQNVQYGREVYVLLRSEMSSTELKGHLDATLQFKNGTVETSDDVQSKKLNKQINCTVITIGGKPAVINGNLSEDNIMEQVNQLIQSNLDLRGDNPALPLVYTTAFLKDNAIAHIQGNTEYITTDSQVFTSGVLKLYHGGAYVAIFYVDWEEVTFDSAGNTVVTKKHWAGSGVWRGVLFRTEIPLPANARNIHVRVLDETGLAWDPWWVVLDKVLAPVGERTVSIYGWTLGPYYEIKPGDAGEDLNSFGPGFDDISQLPQTPSQDYEANPRTLPLLGAAAGDPAMGANSFMPGGPEEATVRKEVDDFAQGHGLPPFDIKVNLDDMITFDDILKPLPSQDAGAVRGAGPDASLASLRRKIERVRAAQQQKKPVSSAGAPQTPPPAENTPASQTPPPDHGSGAPTPPPADSAPKQELPPLPRVPADVDVPVSRPIVGAGGPPSGANSGGDGGWFRFDHYFYYKLMKYQQSCFPCSIHTILANLGYLSATDSSVEDLWNRLHGNLNRTAPDAMQIHRYLAQTFELGKKGAVYTPMDFTTKEDADQIRVRIEKDFLGAKGPIGLVAGVGHAEVFFRTKFGRFIHYRPSPEHDSIDCEYVLIRGLQTLGGGGDFAVGINYYAGEEETVQAANFAMLIR